MTFCLGCVYRCVWVCVGVRAVAQASCTFTAASIPGHYAGKLESIPHAPKSGMADLPGKQARHM
jgi:hypothetical protein